MSSIKIVNQKMNEGFEIDPTGLSPHAPGAKLDLGKSPIYQGFMDYFPRAIQAVTDISAFGASKYAWKGWETVLDGYNRYSNAMHRHEMYKATQGVYDKDSKMLHDAHFAWNAMARLELFLREIENETNT